jgi:hypothetical protein
VQTEHSQYFFESKYKSAHSVRAQDIWVNDITYCATEALADEFAGSGDVVTKFIQQALTMVPGSNGEAWYLESGSEFMRPWVSPVDVPNPLTNEPSYGFQAKLYREAGDLIFPTEGVWFIDYYAGIVIFEQGSTPAQKGYGIPKITCFVYTGDTFEGIAEPEKSGLVTYPAGDLIHSNRGVYLEDGTIYELSNLNVDKAHLYLGIATQSGTVGTEIKVRIFGEIADSGWTWNTNDNIYLGLDGVLTQTAPTSGIHFVIARPVTSTKISVNQFGIPIKL